MKKIIVSLIVLCFTLTNCQKKVEVTTLPIPEKKITKIQNKMGEVDFKNLQFGSSIVDILKDAGLTLNDNSLDSYNVSGDYEEFQVPKNKRSTLKIANYKFSSEDNISLFYFKNSKKIWAYELELINHKEEDKIITDLTKTLGTKSAFFKKSINTKDRPIFITDDGEPETDHIEERKEVWEDYENKVTYFIIYSKNFTKKTNELKIYVLDKSSPKYKEWVSYRSFDMFYNK